MNFNYLIALTFLLQLQVSFSQSADQSRFDISEIIKPDYYKMSELVTDYNCIYFNKDSTLFTGTAYTIENLGDYYFLSNDPNDSSQSRLKIIEFKNGLKDGTSRIIDIENYNTPEEEASSEIIKTIEFNENIAVNKESKTIEIVFIFNDFYIEYGDLSEYVFFGEHAFYEKNGKRLNNIDIEILGDDRSMREVANNEYKGKYLSLIIENKYGVTGEEFGHYESDYQLFYNSVPPYYCGMAYKITTVNVVKDFKTDSPLPPPPPDDGP